MVKVAKATVAAAAAWSVNNISPVISIARAVADVYSRAPWPASSSSSGATTTTNHGIPPRV